MGKPISELLDFAIISAKHWRVIILKTGYCKISFDFFFLLQIFNIIETVEKMKSCQMHIYTVNHNVSYEVITVFHGFHKSTPKKVKSTYT